MKRKRITRTTLEEHEVMIFRSSRGRVALPNCPVCPQQVALITLAEAVTLAGVNSRVIHRWIESGSIHFAETSSGMALVCPASLLGRVETRPFTQKEKDECPPFSTESDLMRRKP